MNRNPDGVRDNNIIVDDPLHGLSWIIQQAPSPHKLHADVARQGKANRKRDKILISDFLIIINFFAYFPKKLKYYYSKAWKRWKPEYQEKETEKDLKEVRATVSAEIVSEPGEKPRYQ